MGRRIGTRRTNTEIKLRAPDRWQKGRRRGLSGRGCSPTLSLSEQRGSTPADRARHINSRLSPTRAIALGDRSPALLSSGRHRRSKYSIPERVAVIGPLGLALIVGSSDIVAPKAALPAIEPAMYYLAAWCVVAGLAFLIWGIEVKGRSIEEIDAALTRPTPVKAPAEQRI